MAYPANLAVTNWGSLQSGNTADLDTNFRNLQVALNGIGNGSTILSTVAISVASIGQANVGGILANSATLNSLTLLTPLPIGSGGTNNSTFSNNAVVVITAGSMTGVLPAANGTVLTSNGTAWGPAAFVAGFPAASPLTNSLVSDLSLANVSNFFDGPTVAQGSTGVWFASGKVTIIDSGGASTFQLKLWDGTTVIDSTEITTTATTDQRAVALSGFITTPSGNIRISARDTSRITGLMQSNASALGNHDSTITVFRIG